MQYNDLERAVLGLQADTGEKTIESWAAQEALSFGSPVFSYRGEEKKCYGYHIDSGKIVFDADLVTSNSVAIVVDGVAFAAVVFDTDHDTTMDAIITEGQAKGFLMALDPNDANNRTIFVKKAMPGLDIGTITAAVTLGSSQANTAISYFSDQVFIGVALSAAKAVVGTSAEYADGDPVNVMSAGRIWAEIENETIVANSPAYISTNGKFSNSGSALNSIFRSANITNADTSDKMAKVDVNGQAKLNAIIAWA